MKPSLVVSMVLSRCIGLASSLHQPPATHFGQLRIQLHLYSEAASQEEVFLAPIREMKAQEIKAELDMRKISYAGCYDKTDLQTLLFEARATGKCDPEVLLQFNKQVLERSTGSEEGAAGKVDLDEVDMDAIKAGDGSLPGGLSPDVFKQLASNPEVMSMLSNPKMQVLMTALMGGGPDNAVRLMKNDPEYRCLLAKLQEAMSTIRKNEPRWPDRYRP